MIGSVGQRPRNANLQHVICLDSIRQPRHQLENVDATERPAARSDRLAATPSTVPAAAPTPGGTGACKDGVYRSMARQPPAATDRHTANDRPRIACRIAGDRWSWLETSGNDAKRPSTSRLCGRYMSNWANRVKCAFAGITCQIGVVEIIGKLSQQLCSFQNYLPPTPKCRAQLAKKRTRTPQLPSRLTGCPATVSCSLVKPWLVVHNGVGRSLFRHPYPSKSLLSPLPAQLDTPPFPLVAYILYMFFHDLAAKASMCLMVTVKFP